MTRHLDAQSWRSPDAELFTHLERDECEVCDAFLASLPGLDGQLDALLLRLGQRNSLAPHERGEARGEGSNVSGDELAWARFKRWRDESTAQGHSAGPDAPAPGGDRPALRAEVQPRVGLVDQSAPDVPAARETGGRSSRFAPARDRGHARRRRWLAAAAVLVLGLGAAALGWRDDVARWTGLKGSDGPASVQLRAVLKVPGEADLAPLAPGANVPSSGALVFRAESTVAGPARLFVQRGDGALQELTQLELRGGVQEFDGRGRGELLGFSLAGEAGRVTLYLVAAERAFTADEARAAITGGGALALAVSKLEVDVAP